MRTTNKEKNRARSKAHYYRNHAQQLERNRKRRVLLKQTNPEKIREWGRKFSRTIKGIFKAYKSNAKRRGIDFSISFVEFESFSKLPCHYCKDSLKVFGLDRVDNSKGYSFGNVVPCCSLCNYMKRELSVSDFLNHCKKIYTRWIPEPNEAPMEEL